MKIKFKRAFVLNLSQFASVQLAFLTAQSGSVQQRTKIIKDSL